MNKKSYAEMKTLAIFLSPGEELMETLICFLACIIFEKKYIRGSSECLLKKKKEIRYTDVAYLSFYRYCCRSTILKRKK